MTHNERIKYARSRRRHGWFALTDKESGEVVVQAKNGCFGVLKSHIVQKYNDELWDDWAYGTAGSTESQ